MVKELPPFRYKPAKGCNLDDEMQPFTVEMSLTFLTNLTNLTSDFEREKRCQTKQSFFLLSNQAKLTYNKFMDNYMAIIC